MGINQSALAINVKVNLDANNRLKVVTPPVGAPSTVTTLKSQFATVDAISEMKDVIEGSPQDGYTLVYDSALNKYVVQQLTNQDINLASVDGGTF